MSKDTMLNAVEQLNKEVEDIFLLIRTSEYRELVELATTNKLNYERTEREYWNAMSELRVLKAKLAKYEERSDE